MRDSSRLGAGLRRYLLVATLLSLALMGWGAVYLIDVLDLDLSVPALPYSDSQEADGNRFKSP